MPTQRVSDDFNRADSGTLGSNWTKLTSFGDVGIASNKARGQTAGENMDRWTGAGWTDSVNMYAEATVGTAFDECGPTVRSDSAGTAYIIYIGSGSSQYRVVKSIATVLTSINVVDVGAVAITGDMPRITVQGTTIQTFRNGSGTPTNNFTDTAIDGITVGGLKPGLHGSGNTASWDSWAAGDFYTTIFFDAATDGGNNGAAGATHSFSHTCTGTNRYLVVAVVGDVGGGTDVITVSYDSVLLPLIGKIVDPLMARYSYLFGSLAEPTSGTNTVLVTSTVTQFIAAGAASYTGVKQFGQPEVTQSVFSNADADSSLALSITPTTTNSWAVMGGFGYDGTLLQSAGAGSTLRVRETTYGLWALFDSDADLPAAPYSMTWTYPSPGSGPDMASVIGAIAPFSDVRRFLLVR